MCLSHSWELIGVYGEFFDPIFSYYGIKVYNGYVCRKCKKHKIVLKHKYKFMHQETFESKITELQETNCKKLAWFEQDVISYNQSKNR